jgi:salicylate hydroxylase
VQGCNVVIAGGGIGGMTAALLLGSAGASVTLLERVAEPAVVGAGILLRPNGLAVLYALGLGEELRRAAWRTPPAAIRDPTGSVLLELPLPSRRRGRQTARGSPTSVAGEATTTSFCSALPVKTDPAG